MFLETRSGKKINSHKRNAVQRSSTIDEKQKNQKSKLENSKILLIPSTLPESELILPYNAVDREFECQVCLDQFNKPVLMPCQVHSICLECLYGIYKNKKKESKGKSGNLKVECPTCGQNAGQMKFKDLKINKELVRIMNAYKKEKQEIFSRKQNEKQGNIEVITSKEEKIHSLLNNSDPEKIKDVAFNALKKLIDEGQNIDNILETISIPNLLSKKLNIPSEKRIHIII